MVGFVEDNPVRAPGLGAELGHLGQEPDEKARPFRRVDGKQIDDHAHIGLGEQSYDLGNARLLLGVADHHGIRKFRIIALGIDDAELESQIAHLLEQRRDDGGLAGARGPRDQGGGKRTEAKGTIVGVQPEDRLPFRDAHPRAA